MTERDTDVDVEAAPEGYLRIEGYIDANVHDEALKRIRHLYDQFDTVVVNFSGGKDSLVCLHLVKRVAEERGKLPVNVMFYDEELQPETVLDFVNGYRLEPWVDMTWLAVQMKSTKYVLGDIEPYIQWDRGRDWIRPKPEWAVTEEDLGIPLDHPIVQTEIDGLIGGMFKGRVVVVNGMRAQESPIRRQSCLAKVNDNWINAGVTVKATKAKPIFDWSQEDVFKFFYDNGIPYCPIYDRQMWAGQLLRVATPIVAESAKNMHKLRAVDAGFYDRVTGAFPEMHSQARYHAAVNKDDLIVKYGGRGWAGIEDWITNELTDPSMRSLARSRLRAVQQRSVRNPLAYQTSYVLRMFINGAYKRQIQPEKPASARARRDREARDGHT